MYAFTRPVRACALVLAAVIATSCVSQTSAGPTTTVPAVNVTKLQTGVAFGNRLAYMDDAKLARALDDIEELGARWVRLDLAWPDVQPDSADRFKWEKFDRVVDVARDRNLSLLPVLAYTPTWARPVSCFSDKCAPKDIEQFTDFVSEAVKRYAPKGLHAWEIWNEPNGVGFWKPAPNTETYAKLVNATAIAIRKADVRSYIVLGGLASASHEGDIDEVDYLKQLCRLGVNKRINAIAFHPYTYPNVASDPGNNAWARISRAKESLKSVLVAHGSDNMPIWITEYGSPTDGAKPNDHVSEARQAAIATDAVATAEEDPAIRGLFWYTNQDIKDAPDPENYFGLRRTDGSEKPAFEAFKLAIRKIRE